MLKKLLIILAIAFITKLLTNIARFFLVRFYRETYRRYLTSPDMDFAVYTASIKKLFDCAGVEDVPLVSLKYGGYGQLLTEKGKLFENMDSLRADIPEKMSSCFSRAEGVFRSRALECFSPAFWINGILFLPEKAAEYLGAKEKGTFVKFLQKLYWFLLLAVLFMARLLWPHF